MVAETLEELVTINCIYVCTTFSAKSVYYLNNIKGSDHDQDYLLAAPSIGFGDFVPGERVYTQKIETSFIVCSMYLMLGMALVAMCFNLMQV